MITYTEDIEEPIIGLVIARATLGGLLPRPNPAFCSMGEGMVERIFRAMRESGRSLRDLARESGLGAGQLSRFVRRERSLKLPQAAKLCEALGLELVQRKKPRRPKGPERRTP
jgi:hypothetical protein